MDAPTRPDDSPPTDDALRQQDASAFAWLVARTHPIVLGLGQSVGLRGADLDDAAADAFLAVYQALPSFAGRSSVTTWVYAIACRTMRRVHARARRDRQRAPNLSEPDAIEMTRPPSTGKMEQDEINQKLWSAVASLEPRSAMAVELFYRRGLSVDEVAIALSCPEGTIKTLLFRARAALREKLTSCGDAR